MNKQLDSSTHLLKNENEKQINPEQKCKFCEQNFIIQQIQIQKDVNCKTEFLKQTKEVEDKKFYDYLVLINQEVNVHQLKNFIEKNKMHLRQIIIQHCKFFQIDYVLNKQNEVGALRMLQEIDFNYMFEMFHFQNLSGLELDMCQNNLLLGTTYSVRNEDRPTMLIKKDTAKIQPYSLNEIEMTTLKEQKEKIVYNILDNYGIIFKKYLEIQIFNQLHSNFKYLYKNMQVPIIYKLLNFIQFKKIQFIRFNQNRKFIKEFDCTENCKMIEYEFGEKNKLYKFMRDEKSQSEEEIVRKLKWGESLDQAKFGEILLNNIISEIKFHLETYKKYTKHAFNQGILLIIGDVLKNQLSLNQLQNLIKINLQFITGVIFKANNSIPEKSFNQLMQYFLQIPNLEMIGFFGSVLSTSNFEEFHYLIEKKNVKYIVLYKSYFLINEINKIIKLEEKNFILNHQRYFIFDLYFNKQYEFTPFSFTIQDRQKKQPNDLLEIEQVYLNQQEYPKKISSWISYFQGKNLSILHNNQSIKLSQKITDIDANISSQNDIYNLFEQLIQTDDMHYINCQILKQKCNLNSNFIKKLQDLLDSKKSFQATIELFNVDELKIDERSKISTEIFESNRFWQISALSFLQGFSRIKSKNYNFLFQSQRNNQILGTPYFIKKNKQMSGFEMSLLYNQKTPEIFDRFYNKKATIEIFINSYIKSYDQVNIILQKFKKLQNMEISYQQDNGIIEQIQFEEMLNLQIQKLTFYKIGINSLIEIENRTKEFDNFNKLIRYVLPKNQYLKSLNFNRIQFDFEKFSDQDNNFLKTIEELTFDNCEFHNNKFLFNILEQTTQLKKLNFCQSFLERESNLNTEILNMEDIPKSLERLSLSPKLIQLNDQDFYLYALKNLNNLKQIDLFSYKNNFQNLEEQKFNLNCLERINLHSLDLNILQLLKQILKYSPNLKSFNLLVNFKNKDSFIDGFKKQDQNNIQNQDVKIYNEYHHNYQTIFNQIQSITFELNNLYFQNEFTINSISKKITKLNVCDCVFQSIQFFQCILEECDNLRYLKIIRTRIEVGINEKFDFSKLNIQGLQKFKFAFNEGFKNLDFPQEILKRFINSLKLIEFDQQNNSQENYFRDRQNDLLENIYFINMFVKKMKLEELSSNNAFSYGELNQMMKKNSSFFNITDFNLKYSWDEESIKNEETNFFKVFDSSNLTIFKQIKKQPASKNGDNIQQIKDEEQNNQNKNKILNKYNNYTPINFYSTFNLSNNTAHQSQVYKGEYDCFNMDITKILLNPQTNDIFQSLQILKLKNTRGINNQKLINLIQRQQNLTDLIINSLYCNDNGLQFNLNSWSSLNLRKIIIKNCRISFELLSKLFQSQNLEELKIDNLSRSQHQHKGDYDDLNITLVSIKLRKLHLNVFQNNIQIKNINQVLQQCQTIEFFIFNQDIYDLKFDNFGKNLQFFFSKSQELNQEQVNYVFKKCQQLKVFEINVGESSLEQVDFDLASNYLKKLTILKGYGILKSSFFFSNYFFENKIKSDCDIYQKDQLKLLEEIEQNKNNMYLEINQQLIYNPSFKRFMEQKQIIGLKLQDFDFQDISNFFNTYSPQLQSFKHLIIDNNLFFKIIYQNVNLNLNLNNSLESLQINENLQTQIYNSTLESYNLQNIKNLCKNLKCLILNYEISSDSLIQLLQNCKLLEFIYFIDKNDKQYSNNYNTNKDFNLDYSDVEIPQNVKSIVFDNFNQSAQRLINSEKMKNCDQLKMLVIKNSEQYYGGNQNNDYKLDLKNISKNLEILKIKQNGIDIEYLQQYLQSRQQKLKRLVYRQNSYPLFKKIISVIDQIEEIKLGLSILISIDDKSFNSHDNQTFNSHDHQMIFFPELVQLLKELMYKNKNYNYELAIQYFEDISIQYFNQSGSLFRQQIIQYLYFYLNSDFLISHQLFYPFLIYSPFLMFQKTQNIQNIKQNYIKENNFNMIEKTIHLLNKHQKYIFGFDQDTFNQYSKIHENILNSQSQIEFLKDMSLKIKLLDYFNIYIPYECSIDKKELERLKLNDIIPPQKLKMSDMSIQFIKSWYAINYYAPLTTETIIDNYDNSLIENSSIANLIQKRAFKYILLLNQTSNNNYLMNTYNKIKLKIYNLQYVVFNQLNSEPKLFKLDHSVLHLEAYFSKTFQAKYHYLIRFLYIIYLFVCAFGIWYFSYQTTLQCGSSLSKYSFIMYFCFGFITFVVEACLFQKCLNFVSHLIPQIKPDCDIGFPKAQINQIKKFIIDIPWLNHQYANYSITFLLSQLSRFDFFTNIGFIYTAYSCKNFIIFYCALASICSITIINLLVFFIAKNLFGNKEKSKLVTGHIDIFYQICNLLSFLAVADILDIVSPSNSVVVKGKMYNQRIIGHFFKILLQDLPLIVLQALQLVSQKQINETVILSIILSCIMFLVSLIKFITLTPSTISQKEFDVLNKTKREKVMPAYLELLSDYESNRQKYNMYEQLKCLKSKEYLLKQIESQFKKENKKLIEEEKIKQLKIQEKFRQCPDNQKSIKEMFGNTNFD